MNTYDEVMIATSLIILVLSLFGVTIYFKDKIEKLEDTVDNLYSYFTVALEPQIKRIREVVNNEIINKKEDNANTCLMPKEGRTMQIMIEIPDEEYENVKKSGGCYYDFGKAIYYGTPLDKIRADIMNLTDGEKPERVWNVDVLQIIDKYRVESEDKE